MSAKKLVQGIPSSHHPLYKTYNGMKTRCSNPNIVGSKNYLGRGITVCDRWLNSFEAFVKDMGVKPVGTTLDRIDNDLGYSPVNCRWATREQQNNNQRVRKINTNNKTGVIGISFTKYGSYRVDKCRKYYGSYPTMSGALQVLNSIGDTTCRENEGKVPFKC